MGRAQASNACIIAGTGYSLLIISVNSVVQMYFEKRRGLAMAG